MGYAPRDGNPLGSFGSSHRGVGRPGVARRHDCTPGQAARQAKAGAQPRTWSADVGPQGGLRAALTPSGSRSCSISGNRLLGCSPHARRYPHVTQCGSIEQVRTQKWPECNHNRCWQSTLPEAALLPRLNLYQGRVFRRADTDGRGSALLSAIRSHISRHCCRAPTDHRALCVLVFLSVSPLVSSMSADGFRVLSSFDCRLDISAV